MTDNLNTRVTQKEVASMVAAFLADIAMQGPIYMAVPHRVALQLMPAEFIRATSQARHSDSVL